MAGEETGFPEGDFGDTELFFAGAFVAGFLTADAFGAAGFLTGAAFAVSAAFLAGAFGDTFFGAGGGTLFLAGFTAAFATGFAILALEEDAAGFATGLAAGFTAGFFAGLAAGFATGFFAGLAADFTTGFFAGLAAGLATGLAGLEAVDVFLAGAASFLGERVCASDLAFGAAAFRAALAENHRPGVRILMRGSVAFAAGVFIAWVLGKVNKAVPTGTAGAEG